MPKDRRILLSSNAGRLRLISLIQEHYMQIPPKFVGKWYGEISDSGRKTQPSYTGDIIITENTIKPYYGQKLIRTWGELTLVSGDEETLVFRERTTGSATINVAALGK